MDKKNINTYEEARKQRLEDNNKRFQDLGILKIAKSLSNLKTPEKKSVQRVQKSRSENIYAKQPRRSCRERNPVPSYCEELDIALPQVRKRSKISSSWASYIARPLDEIKTASYEERQKAIKCADSLQIKLSSSSNDPSFVKSMVRSHVYSCFWLGLPSRFCETYLPKDTVDIVLEDEKGEEYNAVYIGKRAGLSGGWRGFALEHKLDDGDALIFQLVQPQRFKVYIVRAFDCWNGDETPEAETKEEEEEEELVVIKSNEKAEVTRRTSTRKKNNN
ncbi:putative B3 domain-containing protein At5g58280 [Impatiens glandulifera]|uniref:putative B3 domain-containing protein At5g58280 n=1 Tax=Impatiens glandulifera TaxID=253017 RepID=UPI001FB0A108|nr:putative B3 domain-containing protein At5g58280 [Impatiens glandulifera]XP_047306773.1 putative B3 domain-containing protein At5g58280 [Impatiens glandulifera]XP_047306774.1 putative B3 domain-containing protein At5g58280 [Impatiens glandulifera]XP_047306775.1 putative B3 domain-containing protein At5g58280 [Impatiens glandulifera]